MRVLIVLFAAFILAAVTRLAAWQVFGAMRSPRVAAQALDLSRGRIVESHGLLMATDTFTWEIYADPLAYRDAMAEKKSRTYPRSPPSSGYRSKH